MVRPADLQRFESLADREPHTEQPTAEKDAAHADTGWSAYDVWRSRIFNTSDRDPSSD